MRAGGALVPDEPFVHGRSTLTEHLAAPADR